MKKRIADKWVNALRSGEYKQTKNVLADRKGGFCCLGVLCELAVEEGIIGKPTPTCAWGTPAMEYAEGGSLTLPSQVQKWAGMKTCNGQFDDAGGFKFNSLADFNDQGNFKFNEIADVIQLTYKEL